MVVRARFEEIIYEVNNLESPITIQKRELQKAIKTQIMDQRFDMYNQIDSCDLKPEVMLMTKEMWDMLVQDPEFGGNEGNE